MSHLSLLKTGRLLPFSLSTGYSHGSHLLPHRESVFFGFSECTINTYRERRKLEETEAPVRRSNVVLLAHNRGFSLLFL